MANSITADRITVVERDDAERLLLLATFETRLEQRREKYMEERIPGRLDRIIAILESIVSMGSHRKTEHAAVTERLQVHERRLDEQEKGRIPSGNGGEYLAAFVTLALAVITAVFYVCGFYATDVYLTEMGFHIYQFPELTDFAAVVLAARF